MKKLLEAPSRVEMGAYYPRERENILCINVSRYLPKEKGETNFLQEESIGGGQMGQGRSK